ncbi:hypothetical protein BJP34_11350 [Moorena producens PAL-8-15-08-1]|uniref:Uncharacterized protein n=1 Tax=Moorena producens PAL-8-15-08-1 TaxID=1458985 RepID=A0A1D8TQM9_9CYAN|nr:carotenoid oxygenase family protein [Moorena producens]AOW99970.1 hypothetical protein BJP34_11350 [Moorena producens PAL-8-15-08-1]
MTAKPKATFSTDLPNNLREHNTASLDLEMNVIEGEIPSDCEGHAFWLVPTPQNGATPWFNGYGQLYRLDFKSGSIHLKSEQFRTPSVICDQKINEQPWWTYLTNLRKLLFGRLFRFRNLGGLARLSPRLGVQNQCNTAIQAFQDPDNNSWRMFATIDSGRPFEFDLTTLKPVTPVGDRSEWIPLEINGIPSLGDIKIPWIFPMHMSAAHTAYDQNTGEIFIINCIFDIPISVGAIDPDTYIHIWNGQGKFQTTQIIDDRTNKPVEIKQSTHQIVITKNYVVIIDTAFRIESLRMLIPEVKAKAQSAYNQVWLVPRAQLQGGKAIAKHITIPRECVHFYADYEDNDGENLILHLVLASGHDVSEWLQKSDKRWPTLFEFVPSAFYGYPPGVYDQQGFGKCVVNAKTGELKSEQPCLFEDFWGVALPTYQGIQGTSPTQFQNIWVNYAGYISEITPRRLVELYANHPFREVQVNDLPNWKPSGILRWSPVDMEVKDSWAIERGYVVNTPIYVPKQGQTDELEGYIVATVTTPSGSEFWIWQAGNLAAGPITKLGHEDVKFALSLHSAWVPSIAPRDAKYKVDLRQDMDINKPEYFLPDWIKEIFEKDIYPEFEDH